MSQNKVNIWWQLRGIYRQDCKSGGGQYSPLKIQCTAIQGFSESLHQAESVKCQALHVYLCTCMYKYMCNVQRFTLSAQCKGSMYLCA